MKIVVGDVEVRIDGELSPRQIRALLRECAGIAALLTQPAEPEEKPTPISLGFTTERGEPIEPDTDWYFEDTRRKA